MERDTIGPLFLAAAHGDAAAWKALVEGLSPLVWGVVRAHRLAEADAQEVFQTTWFRLAQNLARIREPERVGTWLATTARNECLKVLRHTRRVAPADDEVFEQIPDDRTPELAVLEAEEAAAEAERVRLLWRAYRLLGDSCRELLRVLMGAPPRGYEEAAAALGMAIGSIGPTRRRCLDRLRVLMARLAEEG
ncbi:sigma-70 family RNA polymerase sigma factor [Streptosporangiaceae bacterium NEAU-GS5]|nr:sigma-70 family RNA polymerase sigma factor [Streptosporangiaceae bacterium NEAU-GS5]